MDMMTKYMQITSQMTRDERKAAGHQLKTMLLDCSWAGHCCSPEYVTVPLSVCVCLSVS